MNLQFYVEKMNSSDVFKNFMKENPSAFACSGFFIIDKTGKETNKQHFDFWVPETGGKLPAHQGSQIDKTDNEETRLSSDTESSGNDTSEAKGNEQEGKLMSFQFEDMQIVPLENYGKIPEKLSLEQDIDFDDVEKIILERMDKEGMKDKIQKMLFSLQMKEGKNFLIATVFVPKLGLITATVNLEKMEIDEFEKKSFMDMINVFKKKGKS